MSKMDNEMRKKKGAKGFEKKRDRLRNCRVKRVDSRVRRVDARNIEKRKKKEKLKTWRKIENYTGENEHKGGQKIKFRSFEI